MKTTKIKMTFWMGDKKFNEVWRGFDLGSEGVYVEETYSLTFKEPHDLTDEEKKKIIDGVTEIYNKSGREVRDFKFVAEV